MTSPAGASSGRVVPVSDVLAIRFVGIPEDCEIIVENNAGLDDATIVELLGQALERLGTQDRAAGCW